ncbi:uncharacterized protein L199_005854 [Kwoniella botswanensis]|uniref:uncharacterized protein n=1 Tax=Kwoniella botswanensis TaxID=1268659 RepID=UPI00315D8DFB
MPTKREYSSDSEEKPKRSVSGSSKKSRISQGKKPFTSEEETAFLEIIDEIVKSNLWNAAKNRFELADRKQASIQGHWEAIFKKMKKP